MKTIVATFPAGPIKILFDVLKDLLHEVNIKFVKPQNVSDSESDSEVETDDDLATQVLENKSVKASEFQKTGGISIYQLDQSNTLLLQVKLHSNKFLKYVCKKDVVNLGVNLSILNQLIKCIDKTDEITFSYDNDENDKLVITDGGKKNVRISSSLKLLDMDHKINASKTIEYAVGIRMSAADFHRRCRDFKAIGDVVEIKCINKELHLHCKGDYSEMNVTFTDKEEDDSVRITWNEPHMGEDDNPTVIRETYDLKYLTVFSKCQSLCSDIVIKLTPPNEHNERSILTICYSVHNLGTLSVCISPDERNRDSDSDSDDIDYEEYSKTYA